MTPKTLTPQVAANLLKHQIDLLTLVAEGNSSQKPQIIQAFQMATAGLKIIPTPFEPQLPVFPPADVDAAVEQAVGAVVNSFRGASKDRQSEVAGLARQLSAQLLKALGVR